MAEHTTQVLLETAAPLLALAALILFGGWGLSRYWVSRAKRRCR